MSWFSALGTLLLVTALNGLPFAAHPDAEIIPSSLLENSTLSTELKPPPLDETIGKRHGIVYLINLYAVTNSSDLDDGEERLTNEIIETTPGILAPVATVLLVVEANDEEDPVSLDDIAKELQDEGFAIEKVTKDGETKVIKVDFGDDTDSETKGDSAVQMDKQVDSTTSKVRRKRAPCLKCKLGSMLGGGGGGYGGGGYGGGGYGGGGGYPGGGCQGGCGGGHPGGGNTVGVIPVVVVPVSGYPGGGGEGHHPGGGGGGGHHHHHHHDHHDHHGGGGGGYPSGGGGGYPSGGGGGYPSGGGGQCQTCGGQGGHGPGGGNSWSQSSAQASAQSSSGSW